MNNKEIFRGTNTCSYWEQKHQREYNLDEKEPEDKNYWKIARDIITNSENDIKQNSLLDIGCADGKSLYYFYKQLPAWKFHGIDFSNVGINAAINNYKNIDNITFEQRDIILSPINKDYGIITIFETLEHFSSEICYNILDNLLEHCEWLMLSTVDTIDNCFGEHCSHYTLQSFDNKGYNVLWKTYLNKIDMSNVGDFGDYHYMFFVLEGKLK